MKKETKDIFTNYYKLQTELSIEQQRVEGLIEFKNNLDGQSSEELIKNLCEDIQHLQDNISVIKAKLEKDKPFVVNKINLLTDVISKTAASLHYLSGFQWVEIAEIMKVCTSEALRSRVYRCMRTADI